MTRKHIWSNPDVREEQQQNAIPESLPFAPREQKQKGKEPLLTAHRLRSEGQRPHPRPVLEPSLPGAQAYPSSSALGGNCAPAPEAAWAGVERRSLGQIRRPTSSLHPIPPVSQPGPAPLLQLPGGTGPARKHSFLSLRRRNRGPSLPTLGFPPPPRLCPHRTRRGQERGAEAATPHPE